MPDRPRLYLVAASGFPNYGDEVIAAAWLRHLAVVAPDADVWLDCPYPGTSAVLLDGLHPRARFVDTLWRLAWLAPVEAPMDAAAFVQDAVRNPGLGARWGAGIALAARADVVHVLGGGYVNDQWPRHLGVLAGAVAAARRSGGRVALTGAGLAPSSRSTARTLAALTDEIPVVETRDEESAALLDRGPPGYDDLFLSEDLGSATVADAPSTMLCLQSDLIGTERVRDLAAFALATLRDWGTDPSDLGVVEGIPGHDRVVYALIEHHLPGARFYPFIEIWDDGLPVRAGQRWLSTRFHVHLAAAAAGARGTAVATGESYYETKHRSLHAAGSGWGVALDWDATAGEPGPGLGAEALATARAAKQALAARIYADLGAPALEPAPEAVELPPAPGRRPTAWVRRSLLRR